ncbi:MAG: hypothetical protein O6945_16825 [Gammaproteobacteria bacterium]|nr:hypothetical protein [Gammaproteobacteria bacterium]
MRSSAITIAIIVLSFNAFAEMEILLKDGSRIRGEVQSMQNELYEIRTESMGTIQLDSSQIQSMTTVGVLIPGDSSSADTSVLSQTAVDSVKSSIVNSPGVMSMIMELQNDPQIKAVLADPEIMRAVQNLDLQTLSNNPKIKALMDNSKIKRIHSAVN